MKEFQFDVHACVEMKAGISLQMAIVEESSVKEDSLDFISHEHDIGSSVIARVEVGGEMKKIRAEVSQVDTITRDGVDYHSYTLKSGTQEYEVDSKDVEHIPDDSIEAIKSAAREKLRVDEDELMTRIVGIILDGNMPSFEDLMKAEFSGHGSEKVKEYAEKCFGMLEFRLMEIVLERVKERCAFKNWHRHEHPNDPEDKVRAEWEKMKEACESTCSDWVSDGEWKWLWWFVASVIAPALYKADAKSSGHRLMESLRRPFRELFVRCLCQVIEFGKGKVKLAFDTPLRLQKYFEAELRKRGGIPLCFSSTGTKDSDVSPVVKIIMETAKTCLGVASNFSLWEFYDMADDDFDFFRIALEEHYPDVAGEVKELFRGIGSILQKEFDKQVARLDSMISSSHESWVGMALEIAGIKLDGDVEVPSAMRVARGLMNGESWFTRWMNEYIPLPFKRRLFIKLIEASGKFNSLSSKEEYLHASSAFNFLKSLLSEGDFTKLLPSLKDCLGTVEFSYFSSSSGTVSGKSISTPLTINSFPAKLMEPLNRDYKLMECIEEWKYAEKVRQEAKNIGDLFRLIGVVTDVVGIHLDELVSRSPADDGLLRALEADETAHIQTEVEKLFKLDLSASDASKLTYAYRIWKRFHAKETA